MIKYVFFLLLIISCLSSCKQSTQAQVDGEPFTVVGKGSTFTFVHSEIDSTGVIPESHDTIVMTIEQTGMTFQGKTNVIQISARDQSHTEVFYMHIEPNNELSIIGYIRANPSYLNISRWFLFPIVTKTTNTQLLFDTTYTTSGITTKIHSTLTLTYSGEDSLLIKGVSTRAIKVKQISDLTVIDGADTIRNSEESYWYISPSLGFIIKQYMPVSTDNTGEKRNGFVNTLIDYSIR